MAFFFLRGNGETPSFVGGVGSRVAHAASHQKGFLPQAEQEHKHEPGFGETESEDKRRGETLRTCRC